LLIIKPVGSVKHFFDEDEYVIDVKNCVDVLLYIQSMHPRLALFMKQSGIFETIEDICFLDKDGKIIDPQTFPFYRFEKEDDILYIAPVIAGGGGRIGMIIAVVAIIAVAVALGPVGFGVFGAGAGGTGVGAGFTAAAAAEGVTTGILATSGLSLGSIVTNIAISLALNVIQALFTKTPKARTREITKDSGTRSQNDAFGSLTNSTASGTPIALNYGLMRAGGQFLSGYIVSSQHAQNDAPSVASIFNSNQSPLSTDAQEAV